MAKMSDYETVIGLEVHVQLATASKMFCSASCQFGQAPNTQVGTVSLGLPGSLPVINARAVDLAVQTGLALGCTINEFSKFDRKHYFYPDLPKGYQISQYDEPYCEGGGLTVTLENGSQKFIELTRIHMEEDAGKLVHQSNGNWSEVDLNRAGTPLCEIVTEPVMRSAEEAGAFLQELRRTLKFCGVSDCEMQEGSLRCDANVSVRLKGSDKLGTKREIKNLNSFKAVEAAIKFESKDQIGFHLRGEADKIEQATLLWNPDAKKTDVMRLKEDEDDYRYFPDPDLPPLLIKAERIASLRDAMPELPQAREQRFVTDMGLSAQMAAVLTASRDIADYFEALIAAGCSVKSAANWTREEALRLAGEKSVSLTEAAPIAMMAELVKLVDDGKVSRVVAKGASDELFAGSQTPTAFFTERGQIMASDDGALAEWVEQAIAKHPKVIDDIKGGNRKAAGRLVGEVMKISGGKANPKSVQPEVFKQLGLD